VKLTVHDRAWYERRLEGFGASEAGALLGVSPWKTARQVVLDKGRRIIPDPDAPERLRLRLGRDMEPILLEHLWEALVERHGSAPRPRTSSVLHRMPGAPFVAANVDGFIGPAMVELKTDEHGAGDWGPEDGDPARVMRPTYYLQVLHGLAATRRDVAYLFVQVGFSTQLLYEVPRDEDRIAALVEVEAGMWARVVAIRERLGNDPDAPVEDLLPALEGDQLSAHLRTTFPRSTELIRSATPDQEHLVRELRAAKRAAVEADRALTAAEAKVQAIILDAAGLTSAEGTITWRTSADGESTAWDLVAASYHSMLLAVLTADEHERSEGGRSYLPPEVSRSTVDAVRSIYTSKTTGSRRFNVPRSWTK
jgi:predicted phage-related endonuclease